MNRKTAYFFIGLISIALIGLTYLQFNWIQASIALKEQEFERNVRLSLNNIALKSEAIEAYRRSIPNIQQDLGVLYELSNQKAAGDTTIIINDGNNIENTSVGFKVNITSEGVHHQGTIETVEQAIVGDELVEEKKSYSIDTFITEGRFVLPEEDIIRRIEARSNLFKKLAYDYLTQNRPLDDHEIMDTIHALISTELTHFGVNTPYEYRIQDARGKILYQSEEFKFTEPTQNVYTANLFPYDMFANQGFLTILFPKKQQFLVKSVWFPLNMSLFFIGLLILSFVFAFYIIFKQKKLSEMKTDFINNMTHELKTPVSTISLASEMLKSTGTAQDNKQVIRYAGIIIDENKRLGTQIEKVLQVALIEKDEMEIKRYPVNMEDLVKRAIDKFSLVVQDRNGELKTDLNTIENIVSGDEMHLLNIITNLLDNANKYSPEKPIITLKSYNTEEHFCISITDNGIGMNKEDQKKIFDKFYRVSGGNIHDVKGFGLGLTYVKLMVEAHKGTISVESKLNAGSTFSITLPLSKDEKYE